MKRMLLLSLGMASLSSMLCSSVSAASKSPQVGGVPVGLQLYSLRAQFGKDVPGTLDKVRDLGIHYVELAGTYNLAPERFNAELHSRKLDAVSAHFPFDRFRKDPEGIAKEAKALGLKYAGCAWIDHKDPFDEKTCRDAIAAFNKAAEILAQNGIKCMYHTHGYEFQPHGDGTLFDLLVKETNPKFMNFEMDVFWVVHAGQDPVKLLQKYPGRWALLHIKGMKDSTPTGLLTGHSEVTNDVPLGTGKIDYAPIFSAAKKSGAKFYFIEDESPTVEQQLPQSLAYLKSLK
jgi:sugar phosphate isomerase/epimerase